jgi:hypothetical protein
MHARVQDQPKRASFYFVWPRAISAFRFCSHCLALCVGTRNCLPACQPACLALRMSDTLTRRRRLCPWPCERTHNASHWALHVKYVLHVIEHWPCLGPQPRLHFGRPHSRCMRPTAPPAMQFEMPSYSTEREGKVSVYCALYHNVRVFVLYHLVNAKG